MHKHGLVVISVSALVFIVICGVGYVFVREYSEKQPTISADGELDGESEKYNETYLSDEFNQQDTSPVGDTVLPANGSKHEPTPFFVVSAANELVEAYGEVETMHEEFLKEGMPTDQVRILQMLESAALAADRAELITFCNVASSKVEAERDRTGEYPAVVAIDTFPLPTHSYERTSPQSYSLTFSFEEQEILLTQEQTRSQTGLYGQQVCEEWFETHAEIQYETAHLESKPHQKNDIQIGNTKMHFQLPEDLEWVFGTEDAGPILYASPDAINGGGLYINTSRLDFWGLESVGTEWVVARNNDRLLISDTRGHNHEADGVHATYVTVTTNQIEIIYFGSSDAVARGDTRDIFESFLDSIYFETTP